MTLRLAVIAGLAGVLASCATSPTKPPPVCDGHHLRPANPYGSVLQPTAPAAAPPKTADPKRSKAPASGGAPSPGGCGS